MGFFSKFKKSAKEASGNVDENTPLVIATQRAVDGIKEVTKNIKEEIDGHEAINLKKIEEKAKSPAVISALKYALSALMLLLPFVDMVTDYFLVKAYFGKDNAAVNNLAVLVVVILVLTLRHQGALFLYLTEVDYKEGRSGLSMMDGISLFIPFGMIFSIPEGLVGSTLIKKKMIVVEGLIWFSTFRWIFVNFQLFVNMIIEAVLKRPSDSYKREIAINKIIKKWEDVTETLPMLLVQVAVYYFDDSPTLYMWLKLAYSIVTTSRADIINVRTILSEN